MITTTINRLLSRAPVFFRWEPSVPPRELAKDMEDAAAPSVDFYLLLVLAAIIATLGLIADSAAVIIGAMIIAPLMNPIVAFSYALARRNGRLFISAALSISTGIVIVILVSWSVTRLLHYQLLGPEIFARGTPNLIDLGIAIAAGIAGSVAWSRRKIALALPGVAIAVALVPPICVTGIGLALGDAGLMDGAPETVANNTGFEAGSFLLFLTNFTAMIFCGSLVFLVQGYGRWKGAKGGILASLILLSLVAIPLSFTYAKMQFRSAVASTLVDLAPSYPEWEGVEVRRIKVHSQPDFRLVQIYADAKPGVLTTEHVTAIESAIRERFKKKIAVHMIISNYEILTSDGLSAP
jgi:uncharacterized hydrophobic protein (TIGR00271 family)